MEVQKIGISRLQSIEVEDRKTAGFWKFGISERMMGAQEFWIISELVGTMECGDPHK